MAISKLVIAAILLSLLVIYQVQAIEIHQETSDAAFESADADSPKELNCGTACAVRCKLSSRPRLCKRACGTCCARCRCVPPGTAGNYEYCPCYAKLTTHNDRRKCP